MAQDKIYFNFENLKVYQLALEFADFIFNICKKMQREYKSSVVDQLQRAVVSISNNIAEGDGKISRREKIRYWTYALDSARECIAPLTIAYRQQQVSDDDNEKGRQYCDSICRMLVKLIKSVEDQELHKTPDAKKDLYTRNS
jgi:four helix bundle protein